MRICFTSDLHGNEHLYAQLADLVAAQSPELLILGGDMFPDGDDGDPARSQAAWVTRVHVPRLRQLLERRSKLIIANVSGNHDWQIADAALRSACDSARLHALDLNSRVSLGGHTFVGFGHTPPTPWHVKDFERLDLPGDAPPKDGGWRGDVAGVVAKHSSAAIFRADDSVQRLLDAASAPPAPWVLVSHAPPHGTRLDWLPDLDYPIGSRAVRAFIERARPTLALHGHIHDSPTVTGGYFDTVGETFCVNPGQGGDRLHAVLFDLADPRGTIRHTVLG